MKNSTDKLEAKLAKFNFFYDFVKITGILPTLLALRPKRLYPYGRNIPKGGVLISANHRSYLDPVIVHCAVMGRRLNCLATKDLYNRRIWKLFFPAMHCIQVDKKNFSMASFHQVVERLNDGKAVVIFPEGQINRDESTTVMAFKSGVMLMAHRSHAPILPVYIVKKQHWYERQHIVIGKPFDVCDMLDAFPSMDDLTRVSELLRQEELALYAYYQNYMDKKSKDK